MDAIRERQRMWIGHILRWDSMPRTTMDRIMKGKRTRGKLRSMLLDWVMVSGYSQLKEETQHREEWHRWNFESVQWQRTWGGRQREKERERLNQKRVK